MNLTIRITDTESADLKARAEKAGIPVAQLVRAALWPKKAKVKADAPAPTPPPPPTVNESRPVHTPLSSVAAQRQRDEWLRKLSRPERARG